MLEIGYLIICEDVIHDKNGVIIRKPLPIINPINIPGNFSFKVAFSMFEYIDNSDNYGDNNLRVTLTDSDNNEIVNTGKLIIEDNYKNSDKKEQVKLAEADITLTNVELINEGTHTLTLTLNDKSKSIEIPVISKGKRDD